VLGGRVARERNLPGLSAWGRVADYREYQISQMTNVEIYFDSPLDADQVLDFGFEHVAIATGSTWRRDGIARHHIMPIHDLMGGSTSTGRVVIFDDDHYYMGGVLAELLARKGAQVSLVTPAAFVSEWTRNTLEQHAIHARLAELGVEIILNRSVDAIEPSSVKTACVYSGKTSEIEADAVVLVTCRAPQDNVWKSLKFRREAWADHGIRSINVFGDAEAPGPVAWATYAGHRYARELDEPDRGDALTFRREVTALEDERMAQ